jgi:hypothetical protein
MSITPSTSKNATYTVVGGRRSRSEGKRGDISIIVLHRGGRFDRQRLFSNLTKWDAGEIVSVEPSAAAYDIERLAERHTNVRFLLLTGEASVGEQINLALAEARAPVAMVIWNDYQIQSLSSQAAATLLRSERLCEVPYVRGERGHPVPSLLGPAFFRKRLRVVPLGRATEDSPSIMPYDFVGLYARKLFLGLGGFDPAIPNPYWQKLDFGLRAYMWGSGIRATTAVRLDQTSQPPAEDATPDEGYRRFYLKNLLVQHAGDHGTLPWSRFPGFFLRTGGGLLNSYHLFAEIKKWVEQNRFRFRYDARSITDLWGMVDQ